MPISKPIGVVDIGSNSVRLVIYDGAKRSPIALFNEKALCGLAKNIEQTGVLHKEGVLKADATIRRFVKVAEIMGVKSLHLFATAAVRDAKDGKKFVGELNRKYNTDIIILSGREEAEYAGLGVISSMSMARGVVGDLGGGSLELIAVRKKRTGEGVSFPIGPLRIPQKVKTREKLTKFIDDYIGQFELYEALWDKSFYAVGGSFRNLAKIHMGRRNYPLKVIHNYKVPMDDFVSTLQVVSRMSPESLMKLPGISTKRMAQLPYAALVLERIIKLGQPKNIVFSACGVREGYLFSKISSAKKSEDALISGCSEMMGRILRDPKYGYELATWIEPLFSDSTERERRLLLAACIMSEISCYENTEYRAEMAYRRILDSALIGLNHRDRVFIAKALYCRYSTYPDEHILSTMQPLLSETKIQAAQVIGSAMRLGRSLSCSNTGVLKNTSLKVDGDRLMLKMNEGHHDLDGEAVRKRLQQLAEVMGVEAELV